MDNLRLHRSCETLSIYSFHKIMESSNYCHLIIDWDGYSKIDFDIQKNFDEDDLQDIWKGIYDEYCKLTNDNKSLHFYQLLEQVNYLEVRRYIVSNLIQQMVANEKKEEILDLYIETLRQWKYIWDKNLVYHEAIFKLLKDLKASENKIELKKDELEKLKSSDEPMTLTQQVVKLERALERNLIDPKITSVEKWIELMNQVKDINAARQKAA